MKWKASAPANIALIKYMGKAEKPAGGVFFRQPFFPLDHLTEKDREELYFKNQPINSSLSFSLNHFITEVRLEEADKESWKSFPAAEPPRLLYKASRAINCKREISPAAKKKFLNFFKFLKRVFSISGNYSLSSQNNFPLGVGAASSASSFAALTLAAFNLAKERSAFKNKIKKLKPEELAFISRAGSGSSARSFFSSWCLWTKQKAAAAPLRLKLSHQLIIAHFKEKKTSSTKAHQAAKTSPLFSGRAQRAEDRLKRLLKALQNNSWEESFKISYEEFEDMLSLLEAAEPPLKYKSASSQNILKLVKSYWRETGDGPLATMDAGAAVHLLYRPDQKKQKEDMNALLKDYIILSSL